MQRILIKLKERFDGEYLLILGNIEVGHLCRDDDGIIEYQIKLREHYELLQEGLVSQKDAYERIGRFVFEYLRDIGFTDYEVEVKEVITNIRPKGLEELNDEN